jgi:hypothetical protein
VLELRRLPGPPHAVRASAPPSTVSRADLSSPHTLNGSGTGRRPHARRPDPREPPAGRRPRCVVPGGAAASPWGAARPGKLTRVVRWRFIFRWSSAVRAGSPK